ncbi:MAG: hypothetical protein AB4290_02630 [Spirulina sp.]
MILTDLEIEQALEKAKSAFPKLTDWQYNNENNSEYFGFALWGTFPVYHEKIYRRRNYFITLDTYEEKWQGYLTIGQPVFLWSSADCGDAHLVSTDSCDSLDKAIANLKAEIAQLFEAFS